MLGAALSMATVLVLTTTLWQVLHGAIGWVHLLPAWALLGMSYAGLVTPGGRLLRRSAHPEDLPQLFAAQFSLSHVCWLLAYPLAGWVGAKFGLGIALIALTVVCATGVVVAWRAWPAHDPEQIAHTHDDLPPEHPHWRDHSGESGSHAHPFVIDSLHERWPG